LVVLLEAYWVSNPTQTFLTQKPVSRIKVLFRSWDHSDVRTPFPWSTYSDLRPWNVHTVVLPLKDHPSSHQTWGLYFERILARALVFEATSWLETCKKFQDTIAQQGQKIHIRRFDTSFGHASIFSLSCCFLEVDTRQSLSASWCRKKVNVIFLSYVG